jgi:hypothetical protein
MENQNIKKYFTEASARAAVLGHSLYFSCDSQAFAGRVIDVESTGDRHYLVIDGARWIFETGVLTAANWENAEILPGKIWRVDVAHIESWGDLCRKL